MLSCLRYLQREIISLLILHLVQYRFGSTSVTFCVGCTAFLANTQHSKCPWYSLSRPSQQDFFFQSVLSELYCLAWGLFSSFKSFLHISVCHFHIHTPVSNYSTSFVLTEYMFSAQLLRCLKTICRFDLSVLYSCYTSSFPVLFLFIKLNNLDGLSYYHLQSLTCFTLVIFTSLIRL